MSLRHSRLGWAREPAANDIQVEKSDMISFLLGNLATISLFGTLYLYFGVLLSDLLRLPVVFALLFPAVLMLVQYIVFPAILDRVFRDDFRRAADSPHFEALTEMISNTKLRMAPGLGIIDSAFPVICSYGWWRGKTAVVVSSGLVDILSEDELQCMIEREIRHLESGDFITLMLTGAAPFAAYSLSKLLMSLAMHFRFVRGVRTMSSLGIFLIYVRKLLSFFTYFASRARENRSDIELFKDDKKKALYLSSLKKIRGAELNHGDIPWNIEQKTMALGFLAPLDCWDSFIESLFRIPTGSPLASIFMTQTYDKAWGSYFELFSSHPFWRTKLEPHIPLNSMASGRLASSSDTGSASDGQASENKETLPGGQISQATGPESDEQASQETGTIPESNQQASQETGTIPESNQQASQATGMGAVHDREAPEARDTAPAGKTERSTRKDRSRNPAAELALYLSPVFLSIAAVALIALTHGGLMGLPFLLGGSSLLVVLLFRFPLSFRNLTSLSALMTKAPSALRGYPVVLKGRVYYDGRQSIVPLCLFFENDVIALPLTMLSFFPLELPATGHEDEDTYDVRGWMRREPHFHIEIKSLRLNGKTVMSSALPICLYGAALGLTALGIFLLALQMKGGL
jgi:Zn-dependent protease with chaperone function